MRISLSGKSGNSNKVTEWFGLERILKSPHSLPWPGTPFTRTPQALSSPALNPRDGPQDLFSPYLWLSSQRNLCCAGIPDCCPINFSCGLTHICHLHWVFVSPSAVSEAWWRISWTPTFQCLFLPALVSILAHGSGVMSSRLKNSDSKSDSWSEASLWSLFSNHWGRSRQGSAV